MTQPTFDVPEVVTEVQKELKRIDGDTKDSIDGLQKTWHDFKEDQKRAKDEETNKSAEYITKAEKQMTDLMERLEDQQKRVDAIETKANRSPYGSMDPAEAKETIDGAVSLKQMYMGTRGQSFDLHELRNTISVEEYVAYQKAFGRYCRRGDEPGKMEPEDVKALSVGSDPDGGYFISPQVSARIAEKIFETSPMRGIASVESISTIQLDLLTDIDEPDAGWIAELGTRSTTDTPQIGKQSIVAHEMYAAPKATQTLLEDSSVNVESWLAGKVGAKFSRIEATAFITGNGVGKPRGILDYASGTSWGQIEQIPSGIKAAPWFTIAGWLNLLMGLKEPYHPGASILMRRANLAGFLALADGDSSSFFKPVLGGNQSPLLSSISGYPLRLAADMPAGAASTAVAAFGDFGEAYTIVDRIGVTVQRDPFTRKPYVEFYSRKRVGGAVVNFEAIKLGVCIA